MKAYVVSVSHYEGTTVNSVWTDRGLAEERARVLEARCREMERDYYAADQCLGEDNPKAAAFHDKWRSASLEGVDVFGRAGVEEFEVATS